VGQNAYELASSRAVPPHMPLANSGGTAGRRHRPGLRPRQIVRLSTGSAQAVQAAGTDSPATVLARLGVQRPIATLVLIGGTDDLDADLARRLQRLLGGVAAATVDDKVTIVSGGTAAGVLALFGSGLEDRKPTAPVIGIVPAGKVDLNPSAHRVEDDKAVLEPHHTHFVLVDGNHWGDETPMLLGIVRELARQSPAVVLLASGGDIARQELEGLLAAGIRVIVLRGSGRLADEVATSGAGGPFDVVDLDATPGELRRRINDVLAAGPG